MTMLDFEIDAFNGDGDRKAFLIYVTDVKCEAERLRGYTNQVLYVEATLPRYAEPNYEPWLLRIFHPGISAHITFGFVLIPREFLYSAKHEALCLERVLGTIVSEFERMQVRKIVFASKRNIHFLARA